MRTTIELKPENRAKLLELAARHGEKGFSNLVNEAIENYVADDDLERRKRLVAAGITLSIGGRLWTRNRRHFERVPGLELY